MLKSVVKKLLGYSSPSEGDAYRTRIRNASDPMSFVRGNVDDRLFGLETALTAATDASVLDVGCHNGTVLAAFAKNGASFLDGVDLSEICIADANKKLAMLNVDCHFDTCDLAGGMENLRPKIRVTKYDIVCYLAVHQHLQKQMAPEKLYEFENRLFDMARTLFVLRVTPRYLPDLDDRLRSAGFKAVGSPLKRNVDPSCIYRRQN